MQRFVSLAALLAPLVALGQAGTGGAGTSPGTGLPTSGIPSGFGALAPGVSLCPPGSIPDTGVSAGSGLGGMTGTASGGTEDLTLGGTGSSSLGSAGTTGGIGGTGVRCVAVGAVTPSTRSAGVGMPGSTGVGMPGSTGVGMPGSTGVGMPAGLAPPAGGQTPGSGSGAGAPGPNR
jgi:hypothetical protein